MEASAMPAARRNNAPSLTPEILANLIVASWVVERDTDRLPEWKHLRKIFLDGWNEMPPSLKGFFHVVRHLEGDVLREETAIVIAGQKSAIISRINIRMREQIIRLDMFEAMFLLDGISLRYREEVEWMRHAIATRVDIK